LHYRCIPYKDCPSGVISDIRVENTKHNSSDIVFSEAPGASNYIITVFETAQPQIAATFSSSASAGQNGSIMVNVTDLSAGIY